MVTVRYGLVDGLWQGVVAHLGGVGADACKMLGRMLIGEASLKNLSGPLTIADYAGQSAQPRPDATTSASWPWSA